MTQVYLTIGSLVFACGVLGFLSRRNLILMFLSLELMLFGVSLNFIVFGRLHNDLGGQTMVLLILTVAACEAALALALIVALYRSRSSLDVNIWQALAETKRLNEAPDSAEEAATKETERDEDGDAYGDLPKLTPSGHDPLEFPIPTETRREPVSSA